MNCCIVARDLTKNFGLTPVLKGLSLTVASGETFGLIGPSGSGKSTFLRCLNGLENFDRGDLYVLGEFVGHRFDGARLLALSDKERARQRSRIGMVFQRFNLFAHMTALDNVACALAIVHGRPWEDARAQARLRLDEVGLGQLTARYPAQLSGGQQQRVSIARALATDPALLLFDEPTSALDPERVAEVLDTIRMLAGRGRTMVIVTHELGFARELCDRVALLEDGQLVECAPAAELFNAPCHLRTSQFLATHHSAKMPARQEFHL